jgi:hypothetical protein
MTNIIFFFRQMPMYRLAVLKKFNLRKWKGSMMSRLSSSLLFCRALLSLEPHSSKKKLLPIERRREKEEEKKIMKRFAHVWSFYCAKEMFSCLNKHSCLSNVLRLFFPPSWARSFGLESHVRKSNCEIEMSKKNERADDWGYWAVNGGW